MFCSNAQLAGIAGEMSAMFCWSTVVCAHREGRGGRAEEVRAKQTLELAEKRRSQTDRLVDQGLEAAAKNETVTISE